MKRIANSMSRLAKALRLFFFFRLALVLLIFVFIFRPNWLGFEKGLFGEVDPIDVVNVIKDAFVNHPQRVGVWLGFACVAKLLGITAGVIRWKLLLRGQGLKMPLVYMVYLWFMGRAIGLFLPGTLGLDGFRMVESSRYTGEWIKCMTVIVIEKIIGFIALGFILVVTFPLGMHLLGVRAAQLPFILAIPVLVVVVGLLLLLNPRVIQVGMATIPTPGFIRNKVNKFGVAATSYSGSKFTLVLAVLFGVLVHTGTIFMYFGCRMAVGVTEITIQEVLFASTLIIGLSVLTPTVSGLGVRELVGKAVIGVKVGAATGIGMMHLGLWTGELVPYVLSVPLLVLGGRPSREQLEADVAELRAHAAGQPEVDLNLTRQDISFYRRQIFGALFCGIYAGAFAGAVIGMAEAGWLWYKLSGVEETGMFWWGAAAYAAVFAGVGLGIAAGYLFLYLLADRFPRWQVTFGMCFGTVLGLGAFAIGWFRFGRDVLPGWNWLAYTGLERGELNKVLLLLFAQGTLGLILQGFLVAAFAAVVVGAIVRGRPVLAGLLGIVVFAGTLAGAYGLSVVTQPPRKEIVFQPQATAQGPNIIFIGLDALRADYLQLYDDHPGFDHMDQLSGAAGGRSPRVVHAAEQPMIEAPNTPPLASAPQEAPEEMPEEVRAQLEALGYMGGDESAPVAVPALEGAGAVPDAPAEQPLDPYRAPSARTPQLAAFLRDAILFKRGFAQASWTKPAFATIFTGLYPQQHRATSKIAMLPDSVDTIAELLEQSGYYTQGFSNNPNTNEVFNFDQGHTHFVSLEPRMLFGAPPSARGLSMYNILRKVKHVLDARLGVQLDVMDFYWPAERVTDNAIDWLRGGAVPEGTPFYIYLHYMDPHDPFMNPDAPRGGYARVNIARPDAELTKAFETGYVCDIEHMDRHMGRLFDALKEMGLYDDTLIVVTGDHGEEFMDHGGWWHGQTLYEEMTHVPYFIKLPGNRRGGEVNEDIARHVDIAPTLLHFAGLPKPDAMLGQSLFDAEGNYTNASIMESFAHTEFESNHAVAVRTRDMKLVHMQEGPEFYRGMPPVELYDLAENPLEAWARNLAGDPAFAETRQRLQQLLEAHEQAVSGDAEAQETRTGEPEAPAEPAPVAEDPEDAPAMDPGVAAQLEALGYLN